MALVVETGTGSTTAESYITEANADTYHTNHDNTAWTGASAVKENALRIGTQYIDLMYGTRWQGMRTNETQALDWPRGRVVDRDGFGIDNDTIPPRLKDAVCEAAVRHLAGDLFPDVDNPGNLQAAEVGPVKVEYGPGGAGQIKVLSIIDQLLVDLLQPTGRLVRA